MYGKEIVVGWYDKRLGGWRGYEGTESTVGAMLNVVMIADEGGME